MLKAKKFTSNLFIFLLVVACLLLLTNGCAGGGTSGSGGGGTRVSGKLLAQNSRDPVQGYTVTIKLTNDSGLTNEQGKFDIQSSASFSGELEITFENDEEIIIVTITDIPSDVDTIDLDLLLNEIEDEILIEDVGFLEDGSSITDDPL